MTVLNVCEKWGLGRNHVYAYPHPSLYYTQMWQNLLFLDEAHKCLCTPASCVVYQVWNIRIYWRQARLNPPTYWHNCSRRNVFNNIHVIWPTADGFENIYNKYKQSLWINESIINGKKWKYFWKKKVLIMSFFLILTQCFQNSSAASNCICKL